VKEEGAKGRLPWNTVSLGREAEPESQPTPRYRETTVERETQTDARARGGLGETGKLTLGNRHKEKQEIAGFENEGEGKNKSWIGPRPHDGGHEGGTKADLCGGTLGHTVEKGSVVTRSHKD